MQVEHIMDEIRQGLADTTLSDATRTQSEHLESQQISLRKAHEHASVLGRCGGSLSGRLCRWFSPLAKPVIEQINLFHDAVIRLLEKLATEASAHAETRAQLQEVENRLRQLEEQSKRNT